MRRKTIHRRKFEQEEERLSQSIVRDSLEKKSPDKADAPAVAEQKNEAFEKIKQFLQRSPVAERLDFTQNLMRMASQLGPALTVEGLLPALKLLTVDTNDVKKALIDQVVPLISFLQESREGYRQTLEKIMPMLNDFLYDKDEEVRAKTIACLVQSADQLELEDRGSYILRFILGLAHEDKDEMARVTALKVLDQLASQLGTELCEKFIVIEILSLAEDQSPLVRRAVAGNLVNISAAIGQECFFQRIFPLLKKLAYEQDPKVRQTCVEQTPQIALAAPPVIRTDVLVPVYKDFLCDSNKHVKVTAWRHLGSFIASLAGLKIDVELVDAFIRMGESPNKEMIYECAYHFPGVLLTLKAPAWEDMKRTYTRLVKASEARTKRTLACSLHEIARIVGRRITETELVPVMKMYLRDGLKEVRVSALRNVHVLLGVVSPECRETLADNILTVYKDSGNDWRLEHVFARNIGELAVLYDQYVVYDHLLPIFFELLKSSRVKVRNAAAKNSGLMLRAISSDPEGVQSISRNMVDNYGLARIYGKRQAFCYMIGGVLGYEDKEVFEKCRFREVLERLAGDRVATVRISLAKVLRKHFKSNGQFIFDLGVNEVVKRLQRDNDKDVRYLVGEISTFPLNEGVLESSAGAEEETQAEREEDRKSEVSTENSIKSEERTLEEGEGTAGELSEPLKSAEGGGYEELAKEISDNKGVEEEKGEAETEVSAERTVGKEEEEGEKVEEGK